MIHRPSPTKTAGSAAVPRAPDAGAAQQDEQAQHAALTTPDRASHAREGRLAEVMDLLAQRLKNGESLELDRLEAEWPDLAGEIRSMLPVLEGMVQLSDGGRSLLSAAGLDAEPVASAFQLGDFRLLREIGRGGMGIVYEAEQLSLGRRVALKVLPFSGLLDERLKTRFRNEAYAAATLEHPNIVPVFGSGHERGVYYYAMRLIRGRTAAQWIAEVRNQQSGVPRPQPGSNEEPEVGRQPALSERQEPAPASSPEASLGTVTLGGSTTAGSRPGGRDHYRRVAEIGVQVACALHHAHVRGIVHRDIKPSNLLLDETGHVWVTDFGLAAIESAPQLTMTGDLVGTLRYMSPEQASSEREVLDHRTDIYSLGCTLYELLVLAPAFGERQHAALLKQVLCHEPAPLRAVDPNVPIQLEAILAKAMAKKPSNRYATAEELATDLQRFLDGQAVRARQVSIATKCWRWLERHRAGVNISLSLAALLLAIGWTVAITQASRARTPAARHSPVAAPGDGQGHAATLALPAKSDAGLPPDSSGSVAPPPGLVAWWSGDGHAQDSAGRHHGNGQGGVRFAPGVVGLAFSLDGIDDYIRVPHHDALNLTSGLTIEGWVRSDCRGIRNILSKWDNVTEDFAYCLQDYQIGNRHQMRLLLCETSTTATRHDLTNLVAREPVRPGTWMHVAATFDGQAACIYTNGSLDTIQLLGTGRAIHASQADLFIGRAAEGGNRAWYFSGRIDELSLYNRALGQAEIQSIYRAGAAGKRKPPAAAFPSL